VLAARLVLIPPAAPALGVRHAPANIAGSFLLVVAMIASFVFSWAPYAGDYSRYLPADTPRRAVFWSAAAGSVLACGLVQSLGVAAGRAIGTSGSAVAILRAAMGPLAAPGLAIVVLGTVTANVLNVYTGAISTLSVGLRLPRAWMAVFFGLVGGALSWAAVARFSGNFENFLLLISYWVAPWIGVILAWSMIHPLLPTEDAAVRRRLLWAFVLGVLATVPFMNQALFVGPFARWLGGADIGYWVGFLVAFLLSRAALRTPQAGALRTRDDPSRSG